MSTIDQVDHVVLLMMENRSFDSVLGWLYEDSDAPQSVIPEIDSSKANYDRPFEGLSGLGLERYENRGTLGGKTFRLKPQRVGLRPRLAK